ncbi:MAG TPA: Vms1/Ankzf1 family peptidyl-tRNA hydrolase [Solirubrobacteraceae bacterium]|jgi:peptide subunit release factor 1 (eRF1)|nr:Vms1/Ankzf1 family peptidyl-tRNA hydrolase [Solirubrobacteraceae bacterium]
MAAANDVGEQTVRELAQLRAEGETVLSLYLDLDPAQFATPRARNSEIDSLLDGAHREIESGKRPHAELMALRAALTRARDMLAEHSWAQGAHAIALFVSEPLSLARLLRLPNHVSASWVIADAPFIAPLTPAAMEGRVCVALVDERFARILRGTPEWLVERVSFGDDVHGREKKGGWSQARYQRSQHEEVEAHLRHVARMLHDLQRVAPYDPLLIACTAELWGRVVDKLHADVRRVLLEQRLVLDVGDASIEDVERAAAAPLAERRRAREDEVLAQLREHVGREDGRAAVGLDAVMDALVQRRVATLVYDPDRLQQSKNTVEDAVQSAVRQSAEVLAMRERPELGPLGEIAAILRF